jgi:hypothetical protein
MSHQFTQAAILFLSTFVLVFALGFQSLNVNQGRYAAAGLTSFFIGASQLTLYKLAPDAGGWEVVAYLVGGPLGIISSMIVHRRWMK